MRGRRNTALSATWSGITGTAPARRRPGSARPSAARRSAPRARARAVQAVEVAVGDPAAEHDALADAEPRRLLAQRRAQLARIAGDGENRLAVEPRERLDQPPDVLVRALRRRADDDRAARQAQP